LAAGASACPLAARLRRLAPPPSPLDSAGGRPRGRGAFTDPADAGLGSPRSFASFAEVFSRFAEEVFSRFAEVFRETEVPEAASRLRDAGFASAVFRAAPFFSAAAGGFGRFRAFSSFAFGGLPGPRFLGAGSSEASPLSRGFAAAVFGRAAAPFDFGFRGAVAARAPALARFACFAGASPWAPFAGRPERFGAGSSSESSCGTRASRVRTERVRFFRVYSQTFFPDASGERLDDDATREPRDGGRRTESALPVEYSPGYMFLHLSCREEREARGRGVRGARMERWGGARFALRFARLSHFFF